MKKVILIIVMLCGAMLTGCVQMADLTDKESDMVAEYMAGTVLKYDKNYEKALIRSSHVSSESAETVDGSSIAVPEDTTVTHNSSIGASTNSEDTDSSTSEENIGDTETVDFISANKNITTEFAALLKDIRNSNMKITYTGYALSNTYPIVTNSNYKIQASSGNQLLILSFQIMNSSDKTANLSLLESGLAYKISINSGKKLKPKMSLLMNDLQYMNLNIAAGKTDNAVIIFDVSQEDISTMDLSISNQNTTKDINIK